LPPTAAERDRHVVRTWLEELPTAECVALLEGSLVGRIGVFVDGRPEIFPVNHVYDEESGTLAFPSNAGTKLWGALHWPWTSFEVDGIDVDGRSGWSVLVVGRAEEITDPVVVRRVMMQRRVLWAVGPSTRWVRIVPARISGRRIRAVASSS
jgi:uncharacterized protein